jgi:hypothetical protein
LIDYNGRNFDLFSNTATDGTKRFTLDDDCEAVGLIGVTAETNVEVVYKASQVDSGVATITQTPSGPTGNPSAGSKWGVKIMAVISSATLAILMVAW